jgi:hypothetical protein
MKSISITSHDHAEIELGFFNGCKTMGLTLGNYNWQKWVLGDFFKITYYRPQSSICLGKIMEFCQRCLGSPVLQNKLVVIEMAHHMLGYRA